MRTLVAGARLHLGAHGVLSGGREQRCKYVPCALILHVGNPELFRRAIGPLTRHLLVRQRLMVTTADLPIFGRRPRLSLMRPGSPPKTYHSTSLAPGPIDCLYSELVCARTGLVGPFQQGAP